MKIDFDPVEHRYAIDGVPVPSVTQLLSPLQDFSLVNRDVMERAQAFGQAVHKAVELYEAGTLDESALDLQLRPYLDGYLEWRRHFQPESVICEVRVGHKALGYAGTLDVLATRAGRIILVDIKSGTSVTVGPQTAAYAAAYEDMSSRALKVHERRCLTLTAKGPKVKKLDDPSDWAVFQSCLNIHRFKERRHAA